jgi:hypothetical protein
MGNAKRRSSSTDDRGPRRNKPEKDQRREQGGDPRTLPGSEDLGDQDEPQDEGGMVKGT